VIPCNRYEAKGLLNASIEDADPVIFLEPKRQLYNGQFDGHHERPIVPWSQHPLAEVPELKRRQWARLAVSRRTHRS
jgi:2-oxoisovalerate dehydrogenase E1 component beta subunit